MQPTCACLFLSFVCVRSSKQSTLCVRKTISSHTKRRREWTVNIQTTQNGTEDLCFLFFFLKTIGKKFFRQTQIFCLSLNTPPNSPLSWSVVQQKNGSIKSWSSPCQVTPRKWVLKLFFFFFPSFWWGEMRSQTDLVFKVRKWKLWFLMSCLSGCLYVWWSVKCSVTLTKWLSLCSCAFKWPPPHCHYLCLHPPQYEMGRRNGGHP